MAESKNKSFYADIEQGSQAIDHYIDNMPENEFCALCLVDLDDFRKINLNYGYQMGDRVLGRLMDALSDISADEDILIRFGSDEFIMFFKNTSVKDTNNRLNSLYDTLKQITEDMGVEVGCSIGVVGTDYAKDYTGTDDFYCKSYNCGMRAEQYNCESFKSKTDNN